MLKQLKAQISEYLKDDEILVSPCSFEAIYNLIEVAKAANKYISDIDCRVDSLDESELREALAKVFTEIKTASANEHD